MNCVVFFLSYVVIMRTKKKDEQVENSFTHIRPLPRESCWSFYFIIFAVLLLT